nr:immunoglobulin heavy chain junction region [Macaca mulatta]MOX58845.1 immunoglobulin heavy chain junction region [Macaca mulatta]MOX59351.1 immunoglobulin heavy chain junction region [Macaca mulatta]MOX61137.1 immunoglobulin heavy chain junction region [Macaca mulatta]MOX61606.1 immunoglobulin heavy chain junction region [Macaca mulatta]
CARARAYGSGYRSDWFFDVW